MGSKQQARSSGDTGPIAGIAGGSGEVLQVQLRTEVHVQPTALVDVVGLQTGKQTVTIKLFINKVEN
jgi:hypothetical protein